MATSPTLATSDLDALLITLPREYALGGVGHARFVAGPAGAFIVMVTGDDLERDAQELVQLTNATRVALSDHLPWVPFLDALLVAPTAVAQSPEVTIVPVDLLLDVVHDGHQRLDEATMDRIFVLLAEHRLDPAWSLMGWHDAQNPTWSAPEDEPTQSWPAPGALTAMPRTS